MSITRSVSRKLPTLASERLGADTANRGIAAASRGIPLRSSTGWQLPEISRHFVRPARRYALTMHRSLHAIALLALASTSEAAERRVIRPEGYNRGLPFTPGILVD